MTNGANASYVNVCLVAYVLCMRVNSNVICKMESEVFFAVIENDILCPNEREVQLKFCVQLFGRIIQFNSIHSIQNIPFFHHSTVT